MVVFFFKGGGPSNDFPDLRTETRYILTTTVDSPSLQQAECMTVRPRGPSGICWWYSQRVEGLTHSLLKMPGGTYLGYSRPIYRMSICCSFYDIYINYILLG